MRVSVFCVPHSPHSEQREGPRATGLRQTDKQEDFSGWAFQLLAEGGGERCGVVGSVLQGIIVCVVGGGVDEGVSGVFSTQSTQ